MTTKSPSGYNPRPNESVNIVQYEHTHNSPKLSLPFRSCDQDFFISSHLSGVPAIFRNSNSATLHRLLTFEVEISRSSCPSISFRSTSGRLEYFYCHTQRQSCKTTYKLVVPSSTSSSSDQESRSFSGRPRIRISTQGMNHLTGCY